MHYPINFEESITEYRSKFHKQVDEKTAEIMRLYFEGLNSAYRDGYEQARKDGCHE